MSGAGTQARRHGGTEGLSLAECHAYAAALLLGGAPSWRDDLLREEIERAVLKTAHKRAIDDACAAPPSSPAAAMAARAGSRVGCPVWNRSTGPGSVPTGTRGGAS